MILFYFFILFNIKSFNYLNVRNEFLITVKFFPTENQMCLKTKSKECLVFKST